MSRITGSYVNSIETWVKTHQDQIQKHSAWQGELHEAYAESLIKGHDPFTYLLRAGEKTEVYYITFVKEDRSIKHQRFTLESDLMGWYYKNGTAGSPVEIVEEKLEKLIPRMMHCDVGICQILASDTGEIDLAGY